MEVKYGVVVTSWSQCRKCLPSREGPLLQKQPHVGAMLTPPPIEIPYKYLFIQQESRGFFRTRLQCSDNPVSPDWADMYNHGTFEVSCSDRSAFHCISGGRGQTFLPLVDLRFQHPTPSSQCPVVHGRYHALSCHDQKERRRLVNKSN